MEIDIESFVDGVVVDVKSGNSGTVYIVDRGENTVPRKVAYKSIKFKNVIDEDRLESFNKECEVWFKTTNHYIVTPFYAKIIQGIPYICMPYCDTDLHSLILINDITYVEALVISCQIIKGLIVLREKGIKQHQDLNPPNILIQDLATKFKTYPKDYGLNYDVKISDFGIANLRERLGPTDGGGGGKYAFKAPEQYEPRKYKEYFPDTFALGVIVYLLLTSQHPCGMKKQQTLNKNTSGNIFRKWAFSNPNISHENKAIETIINQTLLEDPASRPELEIIQEVLLSELQKANSHAFLSLTTRFNYYDQLDAQYKHDGLFNLSKIADLPDKREEMVNHFYKLLQQCKEELKTPEKVVYYCEVFRYFILLCKLDRHEVIFEESMFLLNVLKKWHSEIKVFHKYPSITIEGVISIPFPDIRDYEVTSNYISIVINVLRKIKGEDYVANTFKLIDDAVIRSMYFYHSAEKNRQKDIFQTIECLETAKALVPSEALFDYMEFLWIRSILALDGISTQFSYIEKSRLKKILTASINNAKRIAPQWETIQSIDS